MARKGHGIQTEIAQVSGVSIITIQKASRDEPIGLYKTAKAISDATFGAVSIAELCDPRPVKQPAKKRKRKKA